MCIKYISARPLLVLATRMVIRYVNRTSLNQSVGKKIMAAELQSDPSEHSTPEAKTGIWRAFFQNRFPNTRLPRCLDNWLWSGLEAIKSLVARQLRAFRSLDFAASPKDIDLFTLMIALLRGWPTIILCAALGAAGSIYVSAHKPHVYAASMRITPSPLTNNNSASGMLSQVSSIVGLDHESGGTRTFSDLQALFHSNRLAMRLLRDPAFTSTFYPGPSWTMESRRWTFHGQVGLFARIRSDFLNLFGIQPGGSPSATGVVNYLKSHISLLSDSASIVTLSATGSRPDKPVILLEKVIRGADSILKRERKAELISHISYLRQQLSATSVSDYRDALVAILSGEQKQLMAIDYGGPYSYFDLDEPIPNSVPVSPRPILNLVIGLMAGFCFGALIVLAKFGRRGDRG